MQRFIAVSTCLCIASLYIFKTYDPGNLVLWFTTMGPTAVILHASALFALLFTSIKGQFENHAARRLIMALGFGVLVYGIVAMFVPHALFTLKPVDFILTSLTGLSLAVVGLYIPSELEYIPARYAKTVSMRGIMRVLNPTPLLSSTASSIKTASKPAGKVGYSS